MNKYRNNLIITADSPDAFKAFGTVEDIIKYLINELKYYLSTAAIDEEAENIEDVINTTNDAIKELNDYKPEEIVNITYNEIFNNYYINDIDEDAIKELNDFTGLNLKNTQGLNGLNAAEILKADKENEEKIKNYIKKGSVKND